MKALLLTLGLLAFFSIISWAQDSTNIDFQAIIEQITNTVDPSAEELDLEALNDLLSNLYEHKVFINKANTQEFKKLFWLSDFQTESLIKYIHKTGSIRSIYEIQDIAGFNAADAELLKPFISFDIPEDTKFNLKNYVHNTKQIIIAREQQIIEKQKGFKYNEDGSPPSFKGSPIKLYSRYQILNSNYSFGITGEKDAGEEFFTGKNKNGFDFYSFHLQLTNIGILKTLELGDYRVNFGYGLIMGSAFCLGKTPANAGSVLNGTGITKYTSTDENNYFRGIGCTFSKGVKELSLFYSGHPLDATISAKDTTTGKVSEVTTLLSTGIHSTSSEIETKDAITASVFGSHAALKWPYFEIGVTAIKNHFSATVNPEEKTYNQGYFKGKSNFNFGVDYRFRTRNIIWFGEGALSKNQNTALICGLQASVFSGMKLTVLYRNYAHKYQAQYGNAFGENALNQNEKGLYLGGSVNIYSNLVLNGYADFFQFPGLKYNVDLPSQGQEYMGQLTFFPKYNFKVNIQFQSRQKEENLSASEDKRNEIVSVTTWHLRFNTIYNITDNLLLRNRLEFSGYKKTQEASGDGFFLSQDIEYKFPKIPVKIFARLAMFGIDSYYSRIYSYESDLLYTFSIPSFYNNGNRYYLMLKAQPLKIMDVWLKYAVTQYSDLQTIGTGLYTIEGNKKSEIKVQVILKIK